MASHAHNKPTKLCFVTVGATAAFTSLLLSVLDQSFLQALHRSDYTHLLVQYGQDGSAMFENFLVKYPPGDPGRHGLEIDGFDFNQEGLGQEMRLAQASPSEGRILGMTVSHAGKTRLVSSLAKQIEIDGDQALGVFSRHCGWVCRLWLCRIRLSRITTRKSWPRSCRSRDTLSPVTSSAFPSLAQWEAS